MCFALKARIKLRLGQGARQTTTPRGGELVFVVRVGQTQQQTLRQCCGSRRLPSYDATAKRASNRCTCGTDPAADVASVLLLPPYRGQTPTKIGVCAYTLEGDGRCWIVQRTSSQERKAAVHGRWTTLCARDNSTSASFSAGKASLLFASVFFGMAGFG